jgi:hypothetical protein
MHLIFLNQNLLKQMQARRPYRHGRRWARSSDARRGNAYLGQGHEISGAAARRRALGRGRGEAARGYERATNGSSACSISDVPVEFLTWSVNVSTFVRDSRSRTVKGKKANNIKRRQRLTLLGLENTSLSPAAKSRAGMHLAGPPLVVEPQTTTRCRAAGMPGARDT